MCRQWGAVDWFFFGSELAKRWMGSDAGRSDAFIGMFLCTEMRTQQLLKIGLTTGISLLVSLPCISRIGMAETIFHTPGGHSICHCDPYDNTPVLIEFDTIVNKLERWYFYHNHVVALGEEYYFIFNEETEEILQFAEQTDWNNALSDRNLHPLITRWLDLGDSPDQLFFFIEVVLPITFILAGITLLIISLVRSFDKSRTRNWLAAISSLTILVSCVWIYLLYHLESL